LRERELANLTLELGKIIALNNSLDFFLYFRVDPSLETTNVNKPATAFAIAWRN
jgi:hypothetical protein